MTPVDEARAALLRVIDLDMDGKYEAIDAFEAAIRAEGLDVERAKEAAFAIDRNGWSDEYAAKFVAEYAASREGRAMTEPTTAAGRALVGIARTADILAIEAEAERRGYEAGAAECGEVIAELDANTATPAEDGITVRSIPGYGE